MEKFGKSAEEMFKLYDVPALMEMMAASRIQAEWLKEAADKHKP